MSETTEEPLLREQDETTETPDITSGSDVDSLTVIVEVLDRSGSMGIGGFIDEVRNGYNQYIKKNIDLPGRAIVFTVIFDTEINMIVEGLPVEDVPELTTTDFYPGGGTALNDAVAEAIVAVDAWIHKQPEDDQPDNVVIEIQTDGEENSSQKYSSRDAESLKEFRELIAGKEAAGWIFTYVGTEGDAIGAAVEMGISHSMAARTSSNMGKSAVTNDAYFGAKFSNMEAVRSTPDMANINYCFTEDQKTSMGDPNAVDNSQTGVGPIDTGFDDEEESDEK